MTTIAWDGEILAADKRCLLDRLPFKVTKIFRIGERLVGVAGDYAPCLKVVEWIKTGEDPQNTPILDKEWWINIIVIEDGKCFRYENFTKFEVEEPFFAIGSGRDFAIAAMHLGKTAIEAVEIASLFDVNTGDGVDAMTESYMQAAEESAAAAYL